MKCNFCEVPIKKGKAYPLIDRETLKELTVCKDCFEKIKGGQDELYQI